MASARELLKQELMKRQSQQAIDERKLRGMLDQQERIANIDPSLRMDITPTLGMVEEITGQGGLREDFKAPESQQDALRKVLQARFQMTPKQNYVNLLQQAVADEQRQEALGVQQDIAAQKLAAQGQKKMSGEQMKRLGSARVAAQALTDVEAALGQGSSILPEFITGATGDTAFTEAARRFAEGFGRMQSGAAITADEETRFKRLLPRFSDSPEIRQMKLQRLREEIGARMQELGGEQSFKPSGYTLDSAGDVDGIDMGQMTDEQLKKIIGGK